MHTVQAKKDKSRIVVTLDRSKVKAGLILTARGGKHDSRPKRGRTRQTTNQRAMADW